MKNTSLTVNLSNDNLSVSLDSLLFSDRFTWRTFRHSNEEFELHIILSGSCTLDVEGQVYPLSTGDAIVIPPHCFHSAAQVIGRFERLSLSIVVNPGSYLAKVLYGLSKLTVFRFTEKQLDLCRRFIQEVSTRDLYHTELCHAYLTSLLITVFRMYHPEFTANVSPWKKAEFQPQCVVDMFFSSWPIPVGSEQELAQLLHISRRQVVDFLKQNYGMTFSEKYMQSRMDYAAWLLRSTDWRIGEITRQVNYSSDSVFSTAFKKYFGIPPTEYRLSYINKAAQEKSK